MNRIDALFQKVRSSLPRRPAFLAFLTAGDPDLETTVAVSRALIDKAATRKTPFLLEIGFPYSDPIADGPTIQDSYTRALRKNIRVSDIFAAIGELRKNTEAPLVGMVAYSLVFRKKPALFLDQAKDAGLDGLIIPDLPVEESADFSVLASDRDLKLIPLVAPTTPLDRAKTIVENGTGFIYYVSVAGITGERTVLPAELGARISAMKELTDKPICVGFGISKPEHVRMLRDSVDGVIVGSAIVRRLEKASSRDPDSIAAIAHFVDSLLAPLD